MAVLFLVQPLLIERLVRGVQITGIAAAFAPVGLAEIEFELPIAALSIVEIVVWLSLAIFLGWTSLIVMAFQIPKTGVAIAAFGLPATELEFPIAAIAVSKGQRIAPHKSGLPGTKPEIACLESAPTENESALAPVGLAAIALQFSPIVLDSSVLTDLHEGLKQWC